MCRFAVYLSIFCFIVSGCGDAEDRPDTIMSTDEAIIEPLTPEELRGLKIVEHLKNYLELKDANPDAAYLELKESAELTWWNHDLVEEWTKIVFKIDQRGKASINEMIHRTELEVQMAKDKSPYKGQVVYLRGRLEFWQDKKKLAEAEGRDPDEPEIKWAIKVQEKLDDEN